MVRILKFSAYALFFIFALIFFMPKVSLYYYAEQKLAENKIIFSNESAVDNGLSLKLSNADISYDAIESANIKNIDIKLLIFYNSLSVENIELSSMASSFVPLHIKRLDIKYTILNPVTIIANASGEFGEANARLNILDKNVTILLTPSELMLNKYKNTLQSLRRNQSGEYEYVKIF